MKREKVFLPEDEEEASEILNGSTSFMKKYGWKWISEKNTGADLDKGIQETTVILKRLSDNKLFKFEYSHTNQHSLDEGGLNDWPIKGEEVFPKQITTTIYE